MIKYVGGERMINQENIEKLFDCFDESAILLYDAYKTPYIEGLVITCENIMSNSVEEKYGDIRDQLELLIDSIADIEFEKEEIRKAFQYACLKGFKHANISNQMITPDSIGILINYLISKLYQSKELVILDPLVGTGNLLTAVANQSDLNLKLVGVDSDMSSYKLTSALMDLLGYGDQVFLQDTMSFTYPETHGIITDFSGLDEISCYEIIGHHHKNVLAGGFLIGVFDAENVAPEVLVKHAKDLSEQWILFGLITLPQSLFKNLMKNIVIFQRNGDSVTQPEKILLVDWPGFSEKDELKKVIDQLNHWFQYTEFFKL